MFFNVGGEGGRPTFFELVAAERLMPSLKAALYYSLGVMAARYPLLHRVLDHSEESFALLVLALEWNSVHSNDASFAESLYGLARASTSHAPSQATALVGEAGAPPQRGTGAAAGVAGRGPVSPVLPPGTAVARSLLGPSSEPRRRPLSQRQRLLSVFFLVGVPYLREKLKQVYELYGDSRGSQGALLLHLDGGRAGGEARGAGADDLMWDAGMPGISAGMSQGQDAWGGRATAREGVAAGSGDSETQNEMDAATRAGPEGAAPSSAGTVEMSLGALQLWRAGAWRPALLRWSRAALCRLHPLLHTTMEGVNFFYQLLYLLGETPYFSLSHHLLQLCVVRASAAELAAKGRYKAAAKGAALAGVRGPYALQLLKRAWVHLRYSGADFALSSLVVSIFAFKVLEWWYLTAESRIFVPQVLPPPPPPPPPKPVRGGVPLPASNKLCPLCGGERTNPALVAVSGYAFCYRCIFRYVQQYGRCPVTLIPASEDDVRRLYIDT